MTPHVLILSAVYDFSTDLVAIRLKQAGIPYVRLNREQLADHRITLDPTVPELTIHGPSGTHYIGQDLRSVWFRQPVFLRNTPPAPLSPAKQLERSQWTAFLRSLCVFDHAAWMNSPTATYIAESKPYQLSVAAACGFRVPRTIATNDIEQIRGKFPAQFIVKSLDTVLLREGEECLFTYTTLRSCDDLDDENVSSVPLLAQTALETKADLRITIVGGEIFAVRILSKGRGIAGDWRLIPKTELEYEDMILNDNIVSQCERLMHRLGLSFGAIDLIETPDGLFFIEINPTGEWGWLSTVDRPIDQAISSWLIKASSNKHPER